MNSTVPEVAERIGKLYLVLKVTDDAQSIVSKINDILLHGDNIPLNIVSAGWQFFAKRKGVST